MWGGASASALKGAVTHTLKASMGQVAVLG